MNESGSLCPAAKAADIIGDKWVLLILRELFLGASRYNDFQQALPRISPTILSKRLKQLESQGLLIKKTTAGRKSTEYRLTRCGRELGPIIDHLSKWGLHWARRQIKDEETVISVHFSGQNEYAKWWLLSNGNVVDLCTDDPGREIDLYLVGDLASIVEVWMGDIDIRSAVDTKKILMTGQAYLKQTAPRWFPKSRYADIRPKRVID